MTVAALLLVVAAVERVSAQSLLERTANVSGGWVGAAGMMHFHFVHRFNQSGAPARQVQNRPTFLLAYSTPWDLLVGAQYVTRSALVAGVPNEWEVFLRRRPLRQPLGLPADIGVQVGYNAAAESLDSEISAVRALGPLRALVGVRWLTSDARTGGAAVAAAAGGMVRLHEHVSIGGDVGRRWTRDDDTDDASRIAWGAGVHLRLPGTPHTLALQATNTDATTLHAASRASRFVRWGFEFTVPLTTARYLPGRNRTAATTEFASDTIVRVALKNLAFEPAELRVRAGTTIEWHNQDPLDHTVTAEDGSWDSGPIPPDAVWRNRFPRPGRYLIVCTPHPFMRAEVVVE